MLCKHIFNTASFFFVCSIKIDWLKHENNAPLTKLNFVFLFISGWCKSQSLVFEEKAIFLGKQEA